MDAANLERIAPIVRPTRVVPVAPVRPTNDLAMDDEQAFKTDRTRQPPAGGEVCDDAPRACGDCNACCVRLAIPAGVVGNLPKRECEPCPLLGARGCSVYPSRPSLCRDFACSWLKQDDWPPEWRPDRMGLLCISEMVGESLLGALVYELRPEALRTEDAARLLARLTESNDFVVTVTESGTRQLTPGLRFDRGEPPRRAPHFSRSGLAVSRSLNARRTASEDARS